MIRFSRAPSPAVFEEGRGLGGEKRDRVLPVLLVVIVLAFLLNLTLAIFGGP